VRASGSYDRLRRVRQRFGRSAANFGVGHGLLAGRMGARVYGIFFSRGSFSRPIGRNSAV